VLEASVSVPLFNILTTGMHAKVSIFDSEII